MAMDWCVRVVINASGMVLVRRKVSKVKVDTISKCHKLTRTVSFALDGRWPLLNSIWALIIKASATEEQERNPTPNSSMIMVKPSAWMTWSEVYSIWIRWKFDSSRMVRMTIDRETCNILSFPGKDLGHAFDIARPLQEKPFFAHVTLKACDAQVNFGGQPFRAKIVSLVEVDVSEWSTSWSRMEQCPLTVPLQSVSWRIKSKGPRQVPQRNNGHPMLP